MKKLLIGFVVVLGLASCKMEEKPPIGRDQFIELLIDLSVSDGIYTKIYDTDTNAMRTIAIHNARVLEKNHVTRDQFVKTMAYYDNHKEDLVKIYADAVDRANKRKDQLSKDREKEMNANKAVAKADSVKADSVKADKTGVLHKRRRPTS